MRPELAIRKSIERALQGKTDGVPNYPELLIMSNPSGVATFQRISGHGLDTEVKDQPIEYGLGGSGGPDLILIMSVIHRASGIRAGFMLGIECKALGKHCTSDQEFWHRKAESRGMWICREATSKEMALAWYADCVSRVRAMGLEPAPADIAILRGRTG